MMRATLNAHLAVEDPGALTAALKRLATFERRRTRGTERKRIPFFRQEHNRLLLPRGLWPHVQRLAPGTPLTDARLRLAPVRFAWRGDLRDYQEAAVETVRVWQQGVIVSPPGSGKTRMGLALAARWAQPVLWLTHTERLAHQAFEDAQRLYGLPANSFGYIGDGSAPALDQPWPPFTVALIQSLARNPDLLRALQRRIGTVIVDEAHHVASKWFSAVVTQFPGVYRAGLSATPHREDGLGPLVFALLGPPVVVKKSVLQARGIILQPTVFLVETGWTGVVPGTAWADAERQRAWDRGRNRILGQLVWAARRQGYRVLVLVERKDHATACAAMLTRAGVPAYAVMGTIPPELQARRFQAMEAGQAVAVATKLANEGLDYPRMDCLVLATAARSPNALEQKTGRVVRTAAGKRWALIYDLMDTGVPTYRAQVQERLRYYQREGYSVRRMSWPSKGKV